MSFPAGSQSAVGTAAYKRRSHHPDQQTAPKVRFLEEPGQVNGRRDFPYAALAACYGEDHGENTTSKEAYSSGSLRQQMAYHGRFTKFHVKACHWRLTPAADRRRLLIPPRVALPSGLLGQALAESRMYIRGRRRYTRPVLVVANVERGHRKPKSEIICFFDHKTQSGASFQC